MSRTVYRARPQPRRRSYSPEGMVVHEHQRRRGGRRADDPTMRERLIAAGVIVPRRGESTGAA